MGARVARHRQSYIDLAELRRMPVKAFPIGGFVFFQSATHLYVTHAENLGAPCMQHDELDKSVWYRWLERTTAPRTEPLAGFVVKMIPSAAC